MTDPIANMIIRIKNAAQVRKPEVMLDASNVKVALADLLCREGYLESAKKVGANLVLKLKYTEGGLSVITDVKRISKPGQRLYAPANRLPQIRQGLGTLIVSTSAGLMTGDDARKKKLGGELICKIW